MTAHGLHWDRRAGGCQGADELKTHERAAAWEVDAGMGFEACQDPLIGSLGRKSGAIVPAKFARAQNSAPRYFVPASSNHDHVYGFKIDSKGS